MIPLIQPRFGGAVAALAIAMLAIQLQGLPPVRLLAALVLFCVVPGWVLTRWLNDADLLLRSVLAVATSLAVTTVVSLTLLYLGAWSWPRCVAVVVALTLVAAILAPAPGADERSPG